jgi:hypothetical protein
MPKRKLRIVKIAPPPIIGVCERCNAQFKSSAPDTDADIAAQFDAHKCQPLDSSQDALRIVHEPTDNK